MPNEQENTLEADILIAEDSPTQAEQLRFLLEQQGHRVRAATNGREALAAVREKRPSMVITDIVMPEMDGFELCAAIKSAPELRDIPVVIVTSLSGIQDVARSLECGADNFIRKPYDPKTLLARINYILLNLELRNEKRVEARMEIRIGGKKHYVSSVREQIVDLLISTYEEAVQLNDDLQTRQRELALSNRMLRVLYRIAAQLNRETNAEAVCQLALRGVLGLPNMRGGWVWLQGADGETKTILPRAQPSAALPPAFHSGWACLRATLEDQIGQDVVLLECERPDPSSAGEEIGQEVHACVPLTSDGEYIGALNIIGGGEAFGGEELRLLKAVGSQTALAVQRAHLYEHLEELVAQRTASLQAEVAERTRAEQKIAGLNRIYAMLSAINTTIIRVHDRRELFRQACRIAVELGGFRLAWVGQLAAGGRRLEPLVWLGAPHPHGPDPGAAMVASVDAEDGLLGQAIQQRSVLVCHEAAGCGVEIFAANAEQPVCGSKAVLPLLEGNSVVGILALYATEAGVFEDESELTLLREISGDLSFALEYIRKSEQLHHLAFYDALTGLPNRTLIHDRLNQLLHAGGPGEGRDRISALVMVNIERFKTINDTFGWHVGDRVLKTVAERMGTAFGLDDRIGRAGGDHFVVILPGITSATEVAHILDRALKSDLGQPLVVDGHELHLALRFGVAVHPTDGQDADMLFAHAETALRKARFTHDRCLFYAPEMNAQVSEKLSMENRLYRALERGEFELHYQPKLSLQNNLIVGLEALLRWNDPQKGMVSPAAFIPVLEETGLIVDVGRWVLNKALLDVEKWRATGVQIPRVAVNVSAVQMQRKDFLLDLERVLAAHPQDRAYLDLELTESMLMQDVETTVSYLLALREKGIRIAIDDFGTGYSSLSYLKRLPIDQLKIDQSFVREITTDADAASICVAIIGLAHNLRMQVIAEGVETTEQMRYLRQHSCDQIQGYVFSRPLPASACARMLAAQARPAALQQ